MKKIIVFLLILIIALSPLFRGLYFALEATAFLTIIALLSVIYFLVKLAKKELIHFNKWHLLFGSLLVVGYAISFIHSVNVRENVNTLIQFTEYFVVSIILLDYYHDKKQQFGWIVMLPVIIAGFINAVIGLESLSRAFSILDVTIESKRIGATFEYSNTAAIYFTVCLLFSLTLTNITNKILARVVFTGIGSTIFLATLLTGSRGGYIVSFVVLVIYSLIQPPKYKLKTFCSFICMALPAFIFVTKISTQTNSHEYIQLTKWLLFSFLAAIILGIIFETLKKLLSKTKLKPIWGFVTLFLVLTVITVIILNRGLSAILPESIIQRFASFAKLGLSDRNVFLRLEMDKWALLLIKDNWVLGLGGGGWNSLYYSVQEIFFSAKVAHNNYLQVFVESGILGFLSYCAVILVSLWYMFISLIKTKDNTHKLILTGLSCGFLSLVLHSSFDFDLTFPSLALLFWALIAGSAIFLPDSPSDNLKIKKSMLVVNNSNMKIILVVICSCLLSLNGLYTVSAYYADRGNKAMIARSYKASQANFQEASRLDPINPVYYNELAKLYKYYASISTESKDTQVWLKMAKQTAEKSVSLDENFPDFRELLVQIYFDSSMPLEALDNAKRLIECQPCKSSNYELLAKGYLEAADYYIKNNDTDKGKGLLQLCSQIDNLPYVETNETINDYKQQASSLLEKY